MACFAGLIGASRFLINRADAKCRTPRRNPDTQRVLDEFQRLASWSGAVIQYFRQSVIATETGMQWAPKFRLHRGPFVLCGRKQAAAVSGLVRVLTYERDLLF